MPLVIHELTMVKKAIWMAKYSRKRRCWLRFHSHFPTQRLISSCKRGRVVHCFSLSYWHRLSHKLSWFRSWIVIRSTLARLGYYTSTIRGFRVVPDKYPIFEEKHRHILTILTIFHRILITIIEIELHLFVWMKKNLLSYYFWIALKLFNI